MKCQKCKRKFPAHLINAMAISIGGKLHYENVCPLCGLARQNEIHGMDRTNFSPGSMAQSMLDQARAYLKNKKE